MNFLGLYCTIILQRTGQKKNSEGLHDVQNRELSRQDRVQDEGSRLLWNVGSRPQ